VVDKDEPATKIGQSEQSALNIDQRHFTYKQVYIHKRIPSLRATQIEKGKKDRKYQKIPENTRKY
jgi:hypothetical protein